MGVVHIEDGIAPLKSQLVRHTLSDSDVVSAGFLKTRTYTPPRGYTWKILTMYLDAPVIPSSTTGSHEFNLYTDSFAFFKGGSTYNTILLWQYSHWESANSNQSPPESDTALMALQNSMFSQEVPLYVKYRNNTDRSTSGTRSIRFTFLQESTMI